MSLDGLWFALDAVIVVVQICAVLGAFVFLACVLLDQHPRP
jgi:Flp pilus assembly protein protease CpaA